MVFVLHLQEMMQTSKTVYKCWSGSYGICQAFSTTRGTTIPGISLSRCGYQKDNQDTKERSTGIASHSTNKISNELEFDMNRPLKHTLKSVFDKGGKMMLTFPTASQFQVSFE